MLKYTYVIHAVDPIGSTMSVVYHPEGVRVPNGRGRVGEPEDAAIKGIRIPTTLMHDYKDGNVSEQEFEQRIHEIAERHSKLAQEKWARDIRANIQLPPALLMSESPIMDPVVRTPSTPNTDSTEDSVRSL